MLKLLKEDEVARNMRTMLKANGERPILAVAFWGHGAVDSLGLNVADNARVICNLESGATNPVEVEKLMRSAKVKSHPRLHAKLYAAGDWVIVGSSNASSNGLALESRELAGWIEANILSKDASLVAKARTWFEELWKSGEAKVINKAMLNAAKQAWRERRATVPIGRSQGKGRRTLLSTFRNHPEAFDHVFVAAYDTPLGPNAKRKMKEMRAVEAHDNANRIHVTDFRNAWGYQGGWGIEAGYWLIDVDLRTTLKSPKIWGYAKAQTPLSVLKVDDEQSVTIAIHNSALCVPAYPRGLNLSDAEKADVITAVQRLTKRKSATSFGGSLIPLTDIVKEIDRRR